MARRRSDPRFNAEARPPMIDYDPHSWLSHLFDIKGSMVREIMGRVLACVAWSALVVTFAKYVSDVVVIPTTIHSLVGVALGLLLVFRTNVSYERYWEGRRMWGSIINASRDLGRATATHLAGDPTRRDAVMDWIAAFAHAAVVVLRGGSGLGPSAARLPGPEVAAVLASRSVPLAVASRIGDELAAARDEGRISDVLLAHLDLDVRQLIDCLGGCDRIKKTPMPFAYVVHLRRALILYCFTLPFGLVKDYGWGTVLDTLLISYVFFGVEEIGVEIENPFGDDDNDLPIERFAELIAGDLDGLRKPAVSGRAPGSS
ncbi:bestrophin family protein (plasmid) [Tundrisphaera sp. TA3]|uniref:bestrophin family protein n=1 Tax=Tundrisphaera sp. TA3 TaxID=3435775 RepID=UPI003EB8DE2C